MLTALDGEGNTSNVYIPFEAPEMLEQNVHCLLLCHEWIPLMPFVDRRILNAKHLGEKHIIAGSKNFKKEPDSSLKMSLL